MPLALLCAGAAKGLVAALGPRSRPRPVSRSTARSARSARSSRSSLRGAPCDVIVLTAALIGALEKEGRVVPGSAAPLGTRAHRRSRCAAGAPQPDIGDAASLRASLAGALAARTFPIPSARPRASISSACCGGSAFATRSRGALRDVSERRGGDGRARASARAAATIGCTQVTEILYTPGVTLVGALPPGSSSRPSSGGGVRGARAHRDAALRLVECWRAPNRASDAARRGLRRRLSALLLGVTRRRDVLGADRRAGGDAAHEPQRDDHETACPRAFCCSGDQPRRRRGRHRRCPRPRSAGSGRFPPSGRTAAARSYRRACMSRARIAGAREVVGEADDASSRRRPRPSAVRADAEARPRACRARAAPGPRGSPAGRRRRASAVGLQPGSLTRWPPCGADGARRSRVLRVGRPRRENAPASAMKAMRKLFM